MYVSICGESKGGYTYEHMWSIEAIFLCMRAYVEHRRAMSLSKQQVDDSDDDDIDSDPSIARQDQH